MIPLTGVPGGVLVQGPRSTGFFLMCVIKSIPWLSSPPTISGSMLQRTRTCLPMSSARVYPSASAATTWTSSSAAEVSISKM